MKQLSGAGGFVLDLDGCLVLADQVGSGSAAPLPGAAEFLQALNERGMPYVCLTNGSTRTPADYVASLRQIGLPLTAERFVTPVVVAARYIRQHHPGAPVFAFGSAVADALAEQGVATVPLQQAEEAAVVVVGHDPQLNAEKLRAACHAVDRGAVLLATNMAPWVPVRGGKAVALSAAAGAAVAYVTGRQPIVTGKPSVQALQVVAELLGCEAGRLVVVGDDLDVDIRMGKDGGAFTVWVKGGAARGQVQHAGDERIRPDLEIHSVGELLRYL